MIPVFQPQLSLSNKFQVLKTLLNNNISGTSPIVSQFEGELAKTFNRKYAVAVSNGSVALDLALENLGLSKNDEVVLPSFTIISCLSSVLRTGAKPVFCDVDEDSWNMTLENVEKAITSKTKAVMMVHLYGLSGEAEKIKDLCKQKNIFLIEDSAEAHGQFENNAPCGSFGDISTLSFYANKHITTGEGGAVLTDSKDFYIKTLKMRNLDFENKRRFVHENLYWNYRLGGLQAALGLSQIKSLSKTIEEKKIQGNYYQELFTSYTDKIKTPPRVWNNVENHYWVFGILLIKPDVRDKLINELRDKGIETRPFFWPLHLQPALPDEFKDNKLVLPISENLGKNGLYIPIGRHVRKKDQRDIVKEIASVLDKL